MFKKFLITFVLCLGMFGTVAFADTLTPPDSVKEYDYYLYLVENENWIVSDSVFEITSDGTVLMTRGGYGYYVPSGPLGSGNYVEWYGTDYQNSMGYTPIYYGGNSTTGEYPILKSDIGYSNFNIYNSDGTVFFSILNLIQMVEPIIPSFLKDLSELLPIGLVILSTLLIVSLLPRWKSYYL